jgi:hypothetical protein
MFSNQTTGQHNIDPIDPLKTVIIIALTALSFSGIFYHLFEIDFMKYLPEFSFCPFHAVTGLECPGCGMTRAMISLGQLKLEKAVKYNLFSLPLLLLMIVYVWPGKFPSFLQHKMFGIVMFIVVILVWLTRMAGIRVI